MISVIIPTYERAYCLKLVLSTIATQSEVGEIIVVDDAGRDDSYHIFSSLQEQFPQISFKYLRNNQNLGANLSRIRGLELAQFPYIAFCDDDDLLAPDYLKRCLQAIEQGAAICSGVHFYRDVGESISSAIKRFEKVAKSGDYISRFTLMLNKSVAIDKILTVPFTHGLVVARKEVLKRFLVDAGFDRGNGFREESDFQLRAFAAGEKIVVVPKAYAVGMNRKEVPTGGQRIPRLQRFYWTVKYNHLFLQRHWRILAPALSLPYSANFAQALFVLHEIYRFFLRPLLVAPLYFWRRIQ